MGRVALDSGSWADGPAVLPYFLSTFVAVLEIAFKKSGPAEFSRPLKLALFVGGRDLKRRGRGWFAVSIPTEESRSPRRTRMGRRDRSPDR